MNGSDAVAAQRQWTTDVERYLATLRRIPAEVRQSMATREFAMSDYNACVCGWAIRDGLLAATGKEWESHCDPERDCAAAFGGTVDEWMRVFAGVLSYSQLPAIETAFTIAVAETVRSPRGAGRSKRRRIMAKAWDVIAYTYDADTHCPDCAEQAGMTCEDATDSEGNEVGAVFESDSGNYAALGLYCGDCLTEIIPCDIEDEPEVRKP